MRWTLCLAVCLTVGPHTGWADGAFPEEQQLFLPPEHPHEIVLGTNFGLLLSQDDGASWSLVCETLVSPTELVNLYQLGPDDTLFAGHGSTVSRSLDHGCTWGASMGLAPQLARDLFADPGQAQRIYALGTGLVLGSASDVYVSQDEAATFQRLGFEEPDGDLSGVEVARSNDQSVYVTGFHPAEDGGGNVPYVLSSLDRGQTWTRFAHPELGGATLGIAAVDPSDDATLYLRSGITTGHDSLQISHDRGATLQDALELGQPMSGLARADDGTVYVGSHNAQLWIRPAGAAAFSQKAGPHIRCLGSRGTTLYACGDNQADGFVLGRSDDQGATFQKVLAFKDVAGLASCAPVQQACASAWQSFQATFGAGTKASSPLGGLAPKGCGCAQGAAPEAMPLLVLLALARLSKRRR